MKQYCVRQCFPDMSSLDHLLNTMAAGEWNFRSFAPVEPANKLWIVVMFERDLPE